MEHFLTSVMTSHGYLALIIFAFIEACCIPISSEITFAFAGVLAASGQFNLALVIIIGTLAEMAGSLVSYAVGRRGGRRVFERYGRWVLVTHSDLDRAERLFAGRGSWAVAVARALPIVRCFASLGAGVVEVPAVPFVIYSLIGTAAWATGLSVLGYELSSTVNKFFHSFSLVGGALVVVLLAGLIAHRIHAIRKDSARISAAQAGHADHSGQADEADQASPGARPARPARPASRTGGAHRSGRGPAA